MRAEKKTNRTKKKLRNQISDSNLKEREKMKATKKSREEQKRSVIYSLRRRTTVENLKLN